MTSVVFQIGLQRLRNNPFEMFLMFVVPIIFFSIFAVIFGKGIGSGKTAPVSVVFVDLDRTDVAASLMQRLSEESTLKNVAESPGRNPSDAINLVTKREALHQIRSGQAKLAIVLPRHFGDDLRRGAHPHVEILADTSDQIATQVVSAMVRQAIFTEQGRVAAQLASELMDSSVETVSHEVVRQTDNVLEAANVDPVAVRDVLASTKTNPRISMYAAGIAVMFLLFSASGAGGTLLEEQEAGTLERLLSSQLTISQLLAGKWIYITLCGSLQVTVMFIWAQVVFGVDLAGHLRGFGLMTIATAGAAASLALLLATACRSRSQLNGVSVILILTMSALGGSMVPRYIMSEDLKQYGLITFNAWALDGFDKIFWRDLHVSALRPQLIVLSLSGAMMFVAARVCARRWEA